MSMTTIEIFFKNNIEYIMSDEYRYHYCRHVIIIFKIPFFAKTNEKSNDIKIQKYATFKTNSMYIIKIIDIYNANKTYSKFHNLNEKKIYEVGKIIKINRKKFNYYKSIEPIYYMSCIENDPTYTGEFYSWHQNGFICTKGYYKNGLQHDRWYDWYEDNILRLTGYYENNKKIEK